MNDAHYIFILGSAESHYGEGVMAASLASVLASQGVSVAAVKVDHYLNSDAGSLDCNIDGECYVTADGYEADYTLGIYERMTGVKATHMHHITAGQILQRVINDERRGSYRATAVSISQHVVAEYMRSISNISEKENRQCLVVEIGGKLQSIDSALALTAVRSMIEQLPDRCLCVACDGYDIRQNLSRYGIEPDLMLADSECDGTSALPYDGNIFRMPAAVMGSDLYQEALRLLGIETKTVPTAWQPLAQTIEEADDEIRLALVGKYDDAHRSYPSLCEALRIAAAHCGKRLDLRYIPSTALYGSGNNIDHAFADTDAVVVASGDGALGVEGYISALEWCRNHSLPTLGIGLGMQCMAIEFARNVLGIDDATSAEVSSRSANCVIDGCDEQKRMAYMPELKRLGDYPTLVLDFDSHARKAYGNAVITERHRHRYEFDAKKYGEMFAQAGMMITGINPMSQLPDIIELTAHRWYVGVAFNPEYGTWAFEPHRLLKQFMAEAAKRDE